MLFVFLIQVYSDHAFSQFKTFFRTNFWPQFICKSKLLLGIKKRKTSAKHLQEVVSLQMFQQVFLSDSSCLLTQVYRGCPRKHFLFKSQPEFRNIRGKKKRKSRYFYGGIITSLLVLTRSSYYKKLYKWSWIE